MVKTLEKYKVQTQFLDLTKETLDLEKKVAAEIDRLSGYRDLLIAQANLLLEKYKELDDG